MTRERELNDSIRRDVDSIIERNSKEFMEKATEVARREI